MAKKTRLGEAIQLIQAKIELLGQMRRDMNEIQLRYQARIDEIDRRIAECDKRGCAARATQR
jgi:hypothetical protein